MSCRVHALLVLEECFKSRWGHQCSIGISRTARAETLRWYRVLVVNLLKPTGFVMHHQFNIQQLYALPTLYLCVLYLSENKRRLVPLKA
jgi:hypothetical protein